MTELSKSNHPDLSDLDPDAVIDLVVAWRSGTKIKLRRLRMGTDVANEFRGLIRGWTQDIERREVETWSPDADISIETVLRVPVPELDPQPPLAKEHDGVDLLAALMGASSLPVLTPEEIPASTLLLYAFVLGDDPTARSVFVRRANPRRSLSQGRRFFSFKEVLVSIDGPIFGFDDFFDLLVHVALSV